MPTPLSITFFSEILADCTAVPNALLSRYRQLGLTAEELLFLLRIIQVTGSWGNFQIDDLQGGFDYMPDEINKRAKSLIKKGFITVSSDKKGYYNLDGLAMATFELWTDDKRQNGVTYYQPKRMQEDLAKEAPADGFKELYCSFEKEFGRGLSPIESEKLNHWLTVDKFVPELICEALTRAVLQRKATFSYVNGILNRWQAAGYKSVADVEEGDKRTQRTSSTAKKEKESSLMKKGRFANVYEDMKKA